MANKIFLTGATGAVGSYLVEELARQTADIRVGVRLPAKYQSPVGQRIEVVPFDFAAPETFEAALQGTDRVFLVTPPPSLHPQELNLCASFIDAAARMKIRHFVRLSSMWALHSAESSHRRIEQYIEASGLPYTHLRPNIFMQNFNLSQRTTIQVERCIRVSAGDGRVSFIDIRDIAACAARILTTDGHEGQSYTLTGPESLGYADVAAVLTTVIGQPITYDAVSDTTLRWSLTAAHWPVDLIDYVSHLYRAVEQGRRAILSDDLARLIQRPGITLEQYARDHASQWA